MPIDTIFEGECAPKKNAMFLVKTKECIKVLFGLFI